MSDRYSDELEDYKDEAYFDEGGRRGAFDGRLLREPITMLRARKPIVLGTGSTVTDAVRVMQAEHRGAVLVTEDGTAGSRTVGIFTERDVLNRIVDGGKNPAILPLADVMTGDPECLLETQSVAEALQVMSVGGFRHIPVVDGGGKPAFIVSVRDVVQFLVDAFPGEVLNLGGETTRQREGG